MPLFKRVFGKSDGASKTKKASAPTTNGHTEPVKPQWTDAWARSSVHAEEVSELIRGCTNELKARGLNMPFLLLPFRPTSDPSAARTFIRNYFSPSTGSLLKGDALLQELRLSEPMVLASVIKWCWARLPGGIVTWDSYELFKVGENDSIFARDAFTTFIPMSVDSDARTQIIFDFFDLLAAIAAHGKSNGMGGRKLSRYAGWWAFEHLNTGEGFDNGYQSWTKAADATSHLFFAYLRSQSPDDNKIAKGILKLPLSLQALLESTEYPPEPLATMTHPTTKVVMVVETVSPTPFALLRRAKNFEYRTEDRDLQEFSTYEDPVHVLTDECRRVLRGISSSNESDVSKTSDSTGLRDASWSRFEDIGFSGIYDEGEANGGNDFMSSTNRGRRLDGMRRNPHSKTTDLGRPTTPSWADFLSTGFVENDQRSPAPLLLPPDKVLPPISTTQRGHSSQSHRRNIDMDTALEPGELANINKFEMDDAFWWAWISSLAGEEPTIRKAVFGRCALLETVIPNGRWLVMEEQVKGAAVQPAPGAYVAEKKGFFSFASRKNKVNRRKSAIKRNGQEPYQTAQTAPSSKTTIGPDQHARIQAAAAALQQKNMEKEMPMIPAGRRGRMDDAASTKTSSVFTLQPVIMSEASPAMKWASQYDKAAIRARYLGDSLAGRGASTEMLTLPSNGLPQNGSTAPTEAARDGRKSPQPPVAERPAMPEAQKSVERPEEKAPPPPPPVVPMEQLKPVNEEVEQAAEVPLPAETPAAIPEAQEAVPEQQAAPVRPPIPVQQPPMEETPEESAQEATVPAVMAQDTAAPVPKKSPEHKKLKKRHQPGFKGIFGKKSDKGEKAAAEEPAARQPSQPESTAAVAAARAALEGKQSPPPKPASPEPKSGRFAGLRNRPAHRAAQLSPPSRKPVGSQDANERGTPITGDDATPTSERFKADRPRTDRDEEYDQLSRVDTDEREDADREFSKFDQDPINDHQHQAYAQEETQEHPPYETNQNESHPQQEIPSHYNAATVDNVIPEEYEYDRIDEEDEEDEPQFEHQAVPGAFEQDPTPPPQAAQPEEISPVLAQDRWAQIRKNAADRAARQSEEQSRISTADRTDDGETSGEETIESRVARIKARVAELTGNMEGSRK